ncbi:MAG: hypothetical protein L6422_08520 [Candidatus Marinimicrobia bacterium]|nr:hypothetical protein [bacterium]MCG2716310.1 hypothetical protein [Candidatus Neomarinimicrobiota bacterium]
MNRPALWISDVILLGIRNNIHDLASQIIMKVHSYQCYICEIRLPVRSTCLRPAAAGQVDADRCNSWTTFI